LVTTGTERREGRELYIKKGERYMDRQIDKKLPNSGTKQVRVDQEYHRQLKIRASRQRESIKALLEDAIGELLSQAPKSDE
jgi:predicted HicB family RNase H-like nuclease